MFETQKSGNKTSPGEIGLNIRTHANSTVEKDQVSGGVNVLCSHAMPVANDLWKLHEISGSMVIPSEIQESPYQN